MEGIKELIQDYADNQDNQDLDTVVQGVITLVLEDFIVKLQNFVCAYMELKRTVSDEHRN